MISYRWAIADRQHIHYCTCFWLKLCRHLFQYKLPPHLWVIAHAVRVVIMISVCLSVRAVTHVKTTDNLILQFESQSFWSVIEAVSDFWLLFELKSGLTLAKKTLHANSISKRGHPSPYNSLTWHPVHTVGTYEKNFALCCFNLSPGSMTSLYLLWKTRKCCLGWIWRRSCSFIWKGFRFCTFHVWLAIAHADDSFYALTQGTQWRMSSKEPCHLQKLLKFKKWRNNAQPDINWTQWLILNTVQTQLWHQYLSWICCLLLLSLSGSEADSTSCQCELLALKVLVC